MRALTERERRTLLLLIPAAALGVFLWPRQEQAPVGQVDSVPQAEKRLTRLRQIAASLPGREEVRKTVGTELDRREKGLVQAETAPQAQAQVLQILRRVGHLQNPPLDFRGIDFGPIKPYGKRYGEVTVNLTAECGIEQTVNFLADLSNQPELIATQRVQMGAANGKQKLMAVRMTVSVLVPRKLVPAEKKGEMAF